jgi:hypothetical protein
MKNINCFAHFLVTKDKRLYHWNPIVRNTIPEEETKEMMADLVKYLYTNNGFPKDQNQVGEILPFSSFWP